MEKPKINFKKVILGRLESSEQFKDETKEEDESDYVEIEKLKISVRDLTKEDIDERKLPKNTTGVVITKILEGTPLMFISVNDIIVEIQKKKITSPRQFSNLLEEIIKKGAKTLYLAVYNSNNQRSYITVKLK